MTEADRYSIEQLGLSGPGAEPSASWSYEALRRRGADALPALIEGLRHDNWRVRHSAAWLLVELGPAAADACPALEYTLTDIRARVRRAAAVALWRLGPGARDAAPALLVRIATDPDPEVRTLAAQAVGALAGPDPQVIDCLVAALDSAHAPLRTAAAEGLGKIAAGVEHVGQVLEEQMILDNAARAEVAGALARVAPERLLRVTGEDPTCFLQPRGVRFEHRVPMRLAALGPAAAPVRQAFVALLATPARAEALHGLGRVGAAALDTVPAIVKNLDQPARAALRAIYLASWTAPEYGAPRDQILAARMEAGEVTRARVELAAALGDPAALRVLGRATVPEGIDALDENAFREWANAMAQQPLEVRGRIGQAVARDVLPLWQEMYLDHRTAEDTVHALEDWLLDPSTGSWERLRRASEQFYPTQWCTNASFQAAWAILSAAGAVLKAEPAPGAPVGGIGLRSAASAWQACSGGVALGNIFGGKARPFDEPLTAEQAFRRVREVVRAAVVPWALGEGDPVREPLCRLFADYPKAAGKSNSKPPRPRSAKGKL